MIVLLSFKLPQIPYPVESETSDHNSISYLTKNYTVDIAAVFN